MTILLTLLTLTSFWVVNVPVATIRELPEAHSRVESEAFFSEIVYPLEEIGDYVKVEAPKGGLFGWIKKDHLLKNEKVNAPDNLAIVFVNRLRAHVYLEADTEFGPVLTLPYQARLELLEEVNERFLKVALPSGEEAYIQRGDIVEKDPLLSKNEVCELSKNFLGLPYTWGGRTSFGFDCSGFVQTLYGKMGISLPHNSKKMMNFEGFNEVAFEDLKPGDLVFWGRTEEKIGHVGFYLGEGRFIHTSSRENLPWLRYSSLTDPEWTGNAEAPYYKFRTARTLKTPS